MPQIRQRFRRPVSSRTAEAGILLILTFATACATTGATGGRAPVPPPTEGSGPRAKDAEYHWQVILKGNSTARPEFGRTFTTSGYECRLDRGVHPPRDPRRMASRFLTCGKGDALVRLIAVCRTRDHDSQRLQFLDPATGKMKAMIDLICTRLPGRAEKSAKKTEYF